MSSTRNSCSLMPVILFLIVCSGLAACGGNYGNETTSVTTEITSVSVTCAQSSITTNQTSVCTQTVNGTGNYVSSVTWSVSPTSIGSVSSVGLFTPASA